MTFRGCSLLRYFIAAACVICRITAAQCGKGMCGGTEDRRLTVIPSFTLGVQHGSTPMQTDLTAYTGLAGEYAFRPGRDGRFRVPVGAEFRAQNGTAFKAMMGGPRAAYRWTVQGAPLEVYGAVLTGHAGTVDSTAPKRDGRITSLITGIDLPYGPILHGRLEYSYGFAPKLPTARPQGVSIGVSWFLR